MYDPVAEAASKIQRSSSEASYAEDMRAHLVQQYSQLYYQKLVPQSTIQNNIKEQLVAPMVNKMKEEIYRRLASNPAEQRALDEQIRTVFDVHSGIYTLSEERTIARQKRLTRCLR